ncbi:MAG: exonuclease SbcCD subunit D C-terminal domain-containing protein [Myxococcota bacterium]
MRILHTADWHLGQTLYGVDRSAEHEAFLAWLLDTLEAEAPDALVVAGDVFDSSSPPSTAQAQYYGFLAACRRRLPNLTVLIVGGNHDSPQRLDAPRDLLEAMDIRVVGGLPRGPEGKPRLESMVVPVGPRNLPCGFILAVPYLRPRDSFGFAPSVEDPDERAVEGHRNLVQSVLDRLESRLERSMPVAATGHCYMVGGATSDESERRIQRGYQSALPADVYPDRIGYVALGHLHRAQTVKDREAVRYSGSPIPLSMTERTYLHQVVLADVSRAQVEIRPVPRKVGFDVVPEVPAPLEEVERLLAELPAQGPRFLEVRVSLARPEPRLRPRIEAALATSEARLARIVVQQEKTIENHPAVPRFHGLSSLSPRDVFIQLCLREQGREPSPRLMALFEDLVQSASSEDAE